MEMTNLGAALHDDAQSLVFVNVLLQQLGLPVPVVPTLLLAGSQAVALSQTAGLIAAAVLASVIADALWYFAGRRYGYRVLAGLCRLSINPASCVSHTEARFVRWGLASLIVAKFIPGFSTVAPPIAGALRMSLGGFLVAAGLGAALWAGAALLAGYWLRDTVTQAIGVLEQHTALAGSVLLIALALWIAAKFRARFRFRRLAQLEHILPQTLFEALSGESPLRVLDLRGANMIAETGVLPRGVAASHEALLEAVAGWPLDLPIVTVCHCPEDAGAIEAARRLRDAGHVSVRPLRGGYDAWLQHAPAALKPVPPAANP